MSQNQGFQLRLVVEFAKSGYGHIALQAEGQPVWFRKIELMSLEKK